MDELDASSGDCVFKLRAILVIVIANQEARSLPERDCFPHLLRYPSISRVLRHADMDHPSGAMFDNEEQKYRAEEQVVSLHEVTGPNLTGMISQEARPTLAVMRWRELAAGLPHVAPDSPLVHLNTQLQQLPANMFGPPASVSTAICLISAIVASEIRGRRACPCDLVFQNKRNPSRC